MTNQPMYSAAEICVMFDISKSTLLRWEEDHLIPPVPRDRNEQRQYSSEHIEAIVNKQKSQLHRRFERAVNTNDAFMQSEVREELSLGKFLAGDITGVRELARLPELSQRTISILLQTIVDRYHPRSDIFYETIKAIVTAEDTRRNNSVGRSEGSAHDE